MARFDARQKVAEVEGAYEPFTFVAMDGQEYELPHALTLSKRDVVRIQRDEVMEVLESIAPDAFAAMDDMPMHAWQQLVAAWLAEADEQGKWGPPSEPSPPPPNGATPSKLTSSSEAST